MEHRLISTRHPQWPDLYSQAYCSCGWKGTEWKNDLWTRWRAVIPARREFNSHKAKRAMP